MTAPPCMLYAAHENPHVGSLPAVRLRPDWIDEAYLHPETGEVVSINFSEPTIPAADLARVEFALIGNVRYRVLGSQYKGVTRLWLTPQDNDSD